MILPKNIVGRNKIRDSKIIELYINGVESQPLLAKRFNLSQVRISQILQANADTVIKNHQGYDKLKRIHFYNHSLENETLPTAKTKLDLIEAKRKEFEGDGKSETTINNITYNLNGHRKENRLIPNDAA